MTKIVNFPIKSRMYERWSEFVYNRLINKWKVDNESEEMDTLMFILTATFEKDANKWTKRQIESLVDSFFTERIIVWNNWNKE